MATQRKLTLTSVPQIQKALFYLGNSSSVTLTAFITNEVAEELEAAGIASFPDKKSAQDKVTKFSGIKNLKE